MMILKKKNQIYKRKLNLKKVQSIILFSEDIPGKKILIHDNAAQFTSIDYSWFDIKGIKSQALEKSGKNRFWAGCTIHITEAVPES